VVDDHPRFHLDALRWFTTLTAVAGVATGDLVVNVVGSGSSEALDRLRDQGVEIRTVDRFDPRSPHCNKISGALRLSEEPTDGMVVLCDTDVVVLEDPRGIALPPGTIGGKVVDAPLPPLDVIFEIFDGAGLGRPPTVRLPWGRDERTVVGNNNGGLYLVPGPLLPRLARAWAQWARWLLDHAELLRQWTVHVDQVAMAMALASEGIGSAPLGVRWNTPTHDPTRIPPDAPEPAILHYHQQVDRTGRILLTGVDAIDRQIGRANRAVDDGWPEGFPASTVREWLARNDAKETTNARPARPPDSPPTRARRILQTVRRQRP
jgi:hypothetical protein